MTMVQRFSWNWVWIGLFVVGFGVFFVGMPKFYDDYMFMVRLRPWFEAQGVVYPENGGNVLSSGFPCLMVVDTWAEAYAIDNIRIAQLLLPICLIFPKWVNSMVIAIIWGIIVYLIFKAAKIDNKKSLLVPAGLALLLYGLPWCDHFGAIAYQFNYVLSGFVFMLLLFYAGVFGHLDKRASYPTKGWLQMLGAFAFGVLGGLMHEGFAVPVVCALVVLVIFYPRFRTLKNLFIICGVAVGAAVLLSVPGMRERAAVSASSQNGLEHTLRYLGRDGWAGTLFYLSLAFGLLKQKSLRPALSPLTVFAIVNGLVTLAIAAYTGRAGRLFFWMNLVYIIGILYLWRSCFSLHKRIWRATAKAVSAVLLIAVYLNLGYADYYALEYRRLQKEVMTDYVSDPDKFFFGDCRIFKDQSPLVGYMMHTKFHYAGMFNVRWFFDLGEERKPHDEVIFPTSFRTLTADSGKPVPGDGKIRELDGYYFAKAEDITQDYTPSEPLSAWVDFGKGYVHVLAEAHRFRSEADGKEYVWIIPDTDWYVTHFKTIKGVKVK